jgi:RsiW-degrading membrane proteinase PrsW (M82 family)
VILTYIFYIVLGFLPSLIWLTFYLKKDCHPEPKNQIIQIFIWGMLVAPLAALLELFLFWLTKPSFEINSLVASLNQFHDGWRELIGLVFFAPLVEEYLKYKIVVSKTLKDSDFDEPLDIMLYLIIGALGFAAVENLIVVLKTPLMPIGDVLGIISFRFIGATFLHALASGIVGYYVAKSLLAAKNKSQLILKGLSIAIVFHAAYNYLIGLLEKYPPASLLIVLLLTAMALFVSSGFKKLKNQLSVCKI